MSLKKENAARIKAYQNAFIDMKNHIRELSNSLSDAYNRIDVLTNNQEITKERLSKQADRIERLNQRCANQKNQLHVLELVCKDKYKFIKWNDPRLEDSKYMELLEKEGFEKIAVSLQDLNGLSNYLFVKKENGLSETAIKGLLEGALREKYGECPKCAK